MSVATPLFFACGGRPPPYPQIAIAHPFRKCSHARMARYKLDSLSDFSRQGYLLRVRCLGCSRDVKLDPVAMMLAMQERGGRQRIADIEHAMKCRECGHRGAHIIPALNDF